MSEFFTRREAGFTLIEVVVVVALLLLLSSAAVLSLAFYIPNLHLKTVAQDLNIQIQKARLEGIRRSKSVAGRFFVTDVSGSQKYGPIIWVDDNLNSTLDAGEEVLFRLPIEEAGVIREIGSYKGIRFDNSHAGADSVGDGVTLNNNMFVLNSRGVSNNAGSIHLFNARGATREVMITLGGAVRVY